MKFKKYHKIKQFRDIIRDIQFKANFKGLDDEGQPLYEETKKPVLTFTGTVKLHGTNAGICYTPKDGIMAQKRSAFLSKDQLSTHFEFNRFVQITNHDVLEAFMGMMWEDNCEGDDQLTLYGEWAGEGIQKGVGISKLPKSFYFFDCKKYNPITDESEWLDTSQFTVPECFNVMLFDVHQMDIDFNNPGLIQNQLVELTNKVEKSCPVTKTRGEEGVGEGIVWSTIWEGEKYIFKVKGEKHSTSNTKQLAEIDPELLKNIGEFVDYACTENRIKQGIQEVNAQEKKDMPDLLRWVANDIMSEENDVMVNSSLEWKQVARDINNRVRQYYFKYLDNLVGI